MTAPPEEARPPAAETAPEDRVLALPNLFTLVRFPLAAAIWIAPASMTYALSLIGVAALTDVVDGWFARAMRRRRARREGREPGSGASEVGAWLDPVADKTFVLMVVIAVSLAKAPPLGMVLLIAARDLAMIPLVAYYRLSRRYRRLNVDLTAGPLGKIATVSQFAAIIALLAVPGWAWPLAYLAGVVGAAASIGYFLRALRAHRRGDYL